MKFIVTEDKPIFRVKAFKEGWSFSYKGTHFGAIWYNGKIGEICNIVKRINPKLK